MTIEQLLDLPTDECGKISDADLKAILVKYLPDTRPKREARVDLVNMTGATGKLALAMAGKLTPPSSGNKIPIKKP